MKQAVMDPGSYNSFGAMLKLLRRRARMTQSELGVAVGYSETYITRLEGNSRIPDPGMISARFVDALNLRDEPRLAQQLITLAEAARGGIDNGFNEAVSQHAAAIQSNLPIQLTSFVGRKHELEEVTRLLGESRLVTLTGSGGVGKTRLAMKAAMVIRDHFRDGVWFVALASVTNAVLASRALAGAFSLPEQPGHSPIDTISAHIGNRYLLLIIDNCEHLIQVCAELVEVLLRACPNLHILTTSREWLNVSGETAWRVPSLTISETLQLFLDRAHAAAPGFSVTNQNTAAVESICTQLDGIPLAVELAAARLNGMSAEELATRLGDRFQLLTCGSRTALPRQQTLRATIDWSYDLLSEQERRLLRWLSIFVNGWTMEAAERVCACPEGCDVLSLLLNLVDKSLVVVDDRHGVTRYSMLEMIRQYAKEHQTAWGEAEEAHRRHARFYLALVQEYAPAVMKQAGVPGLFSLVAGSRPWLQHVDPERDNLRAALVWCLREARDAADVDTGVQLALWLSFYWELRGPRPEGREWMETALACTDPSARTQTRARLLVALATFNRWMGEAERGESNAREALAISRDLGDRMGIVGALSRLSEQSRVGVEEAKALIEEWLSIARDLRDALLTGVGLWYLGLNRQHTGDFAHAAELYDESLRVLPAQELGAIQVAKYYQGTLMWAQFGGECGLAQVNEALAHFRETGFELGVITVLLWLGDRAVSMNEAQLARKYLNECLQVAYRDGAWGMFVSCIGSLAGAELLADQPARAVMLMSAAQRLNASAVSAEQRECIAAAYSQLDELSLASIEAEGHTMNYEQIVEYALAG